jgi:hypothetical protein
VGVYVTVRGWLECDRTQLAMIEAITSSEGPDRPYAGGWTFSQRQCAWTSLIFFGADLRQESVPEVLDQLRAIARLPASDEDNDLVSGLFLASHETEGTREWHIHSGAVAIADPGARFRYLEK